MIPAGDLEAIDAALAPLWPQLDGARLFVTGGTGFIGQWMLEALVCAPIEIEVTLLSRDPAGFAKRAPHLAGMCRMVEGDILSLPQIGSGFTHIIHGATDASAALNQADPLLMFDTIERGTRAVLDLARQCDARVLMMSSGAIYGLQPWKVSHVGENFRNGPDPRDPSSAYGEGKRAAEMLCAIYGKQFGVDVVTARIFALLGPLLSLDIHFAAGNFIRDAIAGRTIRVEGSGEAVRSYLYAADLAVWLWTLLISAPPGATYNVGSEEDVSIAELARRTAAVLGAPEVEILGRPDPGWNPGRYVPSTARVRGELGLSATVPLNEAIRRTAAANGWTP